MFLSLRGLINCYYDMHKLRIWYTLYVSVCVCVCSWSCILLVSIPWHLVFWHVVVDAAVCTRRHESQSRTSFPFDVVRQQCWTPLWVKGTWTDSVNQIIHVRCMNYDVTKRTNTTCHTDSSLSELPSTVLVVLYCPNDAPKVLITQGLKRQLFLAQIWSSSEGKQPVTKWLRKSPRSNHGQSLKYEHVLCKVLEDMLP